MRQEVMDIVLKATDNASPTFEAVEDAAEDLKKVQTAQVCQMNLTVYQKN